MCSFPLFVFYGAFALAEFRLGHELSRSGKITEGKVRKRALSARFYVDYSYQANESIPQQATQEVSPLHYLRLKDGTPVPVIYLPNKPHIARLAGNHYDNVDLVRTILFGTVLLFTLLAALLNSAQ
jgi:hypothetical protein